jgi:short subunit dehydrogenase-like uncharacterized protein
MSGGRVRSRAGPATTARCGRGCCRCLRSTRRSWSVQPGCFDRYGPDFSYSHFVALGNPVAAAALTAGAVATFALAQVPPARKLLLRLRPSGAGPTARQREKGWFRVRFVGEAGDRRVVTEVAGGDPGYGETSKMLAESALCLASDPLPETAGQVTTAVAMGDALRRRLESAGISFRVLESV